MDKIRILLTGGTFEKQYDEIQGALTFKKSALPEILKIIRCTAPCEVEEVTLIDSLDMNEDDRTAIVDACRKSSEKRIIIIHGTDTMTNTAERLSGEIKGKRIVLTGAMVPYSIKDSDALFNLGTAFHAVGCGGDGVFIAMNGRLFEAGKVKKNRETGLFEDLL